MIHLQTTVPNWLEAVALLPPGSIVLAVDQVQESQHLTEVVKGGVIHPLGREYKVLHKHVNAAQKVERDKVLHALPRAMASNPGVQFALRHHYDYGQQSDGDWEFQLQRARDYFETFVDGTFRQFAQFVDYVLEFNEYYANSQNTAEKEAWASQSAAMVWVWVNEYRTQADYAHIKIVTANAAVGNDIPRAAALTYWNNRTAVVVGYHPYSYWKNNERSATDWEDFSGRWDLMERSWGIPVEWMFTEAGPFESAITGWRSDICLGGSVERYVEAVREWIQDIKTTAAWAEGRIHGFALFTTGGPGWAGFETRQPELNTMARMVAEEWIVGAPPPPPPPDPPAPPPPDPDPNYAAVFHLLPQDATLNEKFDVMAMTHEDRTTYGQSAHDAAELVSRGREPGSYVVVWDADRWADPIGPWLHDHGVVEVRYENLGGATPPPPVPVILDIVDQLPKHPTKVYSTRLLSGIEWLVIHHTVSPPDRAIVSIAQYHVNDPPNGKGWPGIGYHFVIKDSGLIYRTNYLDTKSYHAGVWGTGVDENARAVGIALQGDFTDHAPPQAQLDAARLLVAYLRGTLPQALTVLGHREIPEASTACPGASYFDWIDYVAGSLAGTGGL